MNQSIKLTKKEAAPFLQAAGIVNYTGRKFHVELTENVTFYNTNWDGGSRNYYTALRMSDSASSPVKYYAPWCNPIEGQSVDLPADCLVVCHSYYCGEDLGITVYANPSLAPKWLN